MRKPSVHPRMSCASRRGVKRREFPGDTGGGASGEVATVALPLSSPWRKAGPRDGCPCGNRLITRNRPRPCRSPGRRGCVRHGVGAGLPRAFENVVLAQDGTSRWMSLRQPFDHAEPSEALPFARATGMCRAWCFGGLPLGFENVVLAQGRTSRRVPQTVFVDHVEPPEVLAFAWTTGKARPSYRRPPAKGVLPSRPRMRRRRKFSRLITPYSRTRWRSPGRWVICASM